MFIVVNHTIKNPAYFWGSAQKNLPNLPEAGVQRVLNVFPNQNMDVAVCVWEADSIETLDAYLRDKVGDASDDSFYEINQANAIGFQQQVEPQRHSDTEEHGNNFKSQISNLK